MDSEKETLASGTKLLPLGDIPESLNVEFYKAGHQTNYPENTPILNLGQEQDHLFFLESGIIAVINIHGGRMYEVAKIQAGSFFGEIGFFTDHTSTVSLKAETASTVWAISKTEFTDFLESHPQYTRVILYSFLGTICHQLRKVYEHQDA